MARDEMKTIESRMEELEAEIQILLLPKDPNDDRNVMLEIRAGTGGSEANIFAGTLMFLLCFFICLIAKTFYLMLLYKKVIYLTYIANTYQSKVGQLQPSIHLLEMMVGINLSLSK